MLFTAALNMCSALGAAWSSGSPWSALPYVHIHKVNDACPTHQAPNNHGTVISSSAAEQRSGMKQYAYFYTEGRFAYAAAGQFNIRLSFVSGLYHTSRCIPRSCAIRCVTTSGAVTLAATACKLVTSAVQFMTVGFVFGRPFHMVTDPQKCRAKTPHQYPIDAFAGGASPNLPYSFVLPSIAPQIQHGQNDPGTTSPAYQAVRAFH